ncbi:MAG: alpha-2-macroglobulin family protein [Bacteroidales bacterium]|nr:alpha-2-macroglobulin family protein [Bacteroidales bacterium]
MKTKIFAFAPLLFVLLVFFSFASRAQNQQIPKQDFTKVWISVDSLTNLGQPKSALALVNKIYLQAKNGKNTPQYLKAILYRVRLNSDFQEDFLNQTIRDLKNDLKQSEEPAVSVIHSILGEFYWKYEQQNAYRFRNRTQTTTVKSDSLAAWDLHTIAEAITNEYLLSLANQHLTKTIPIKSWKAVLEFPEKNEEGMSIQLQPTLYDFLASRALSFFTSNRDLFNQPPLGFQINRPEFFAPTSQFIGFLPGTTPFSDHFLHYDSISSDYIAFRLYQQLLEFHLGDKDPTALTDAELNRLEFVKNQSVAVNADSLYGQALIDLEKTKLSFPCGTNVSYTLANWFKEQGQLYQPLVSDKHQWDLKTALGVCKAAIKRFPLSAGAKNCNNLVKTIRETTLQLTAESAIVAEKPALALLDYQNLHGVFFRLVKLDPETYDEKIGPLDNKKLLEYLRSLEVVKAWTVNLPDEGDFQHHRTEIPIPGVAPGLYMLLGSSDQDFKDPAHTYGYTPLWSTSISYISKHNDDGSLNYFILNRETGLPIAGAKVEVWVKKYDYHSRQYTSSKLADYTTDQQGFFSIPPVENNARNTSPYLKIRMKDDFFITSSYLQYPVSTSEKSALQTFFYTDRAIYRPGQNIYFKGILVEKTGARTSIKPGYTTQVIFTGANGQQIAKQSFTTNEFGSFHGSFTAPQGVLLGQMTISNESGSASVSVEEYKRPTFEVTFQPLEGNYRLSESLTVAGKASAYSGNPIDQATVKFRVVRTARFPFWERGWYWPKPENSESDITQGITKTDQDGKFQVVFVATPDLTIEKNTKPVFDFVVYADVTDLNGETQSVQQTVSVGYQSLLVDAGIPELVSLSTDTLFKIKTTNLNGKPTPVNMTITLRQLRQPDRAFKPRLWEQPDRPLMTRTEFYSQFPYDIYGDENNPATWHKTNTLFIKTWNTASDSLLNFRNTSTIIRNPGSYQLTLSAVDPFGEKIETNTFFTVYDPSSKEVPEQTINWFVPLKTSGEPGENAKFLIGSKEDNINMIYEIRVHDSLVSRAHLQLSDQSSLLEIPIRENYRGNFTVNFFFVKFNRVFKNSQVVQVPYTNKKLDIAFETFRNKLEPGATEEWKIRITNPKKQGVRAEFLASMYDASLDVFHTNPWTFNLFPHYLGLDFWDVEASFITTSGQWYNSREENESDFFPVYYHLNWFGLAYFDGFGHNLYLRKSAAGMVEAPVNVPGISQQAELSFPAISEDTEVSASGKNAVITQIKPPSPGIQIRRDFRETAFFYPDLVTDSTGNLILKFTVPESLTRWKLQGLATTKDLNYGLVEKELVTKKELMVFPNFPRFVRQGDTVLVSARVVNLTETPLNGSAMLSLTDPLSQQSLNSLILSSPAPQLIRSSAVFTWKIYIPVNSSLSVLQYRCMANAGNFSDGEESILPVLTNRMLVTETLPLPVRGKESVDFTFEKLLKSTAEGNSGTTLKNYRLTLEFASNPAWYAIQALPSLNEQPYKHADAIFAAFYANSIASFIANSNPRIKTVFESWKTLTPDALSSNLEKNQSLKSAVLQETPWSTEAKSESERKQKLGLFFDLNNLEQSLRTNLLMLQKFQLPSGAWAWFEGMPENRWITQNIITGLGHLDHLGIAGIKKDPATWQMVQKGIKYLDNELLKDYQNLKNDNKVKLEENHLSATQIQYLYARSYFLNNPAFNNKEAFDYYTKQAEKYWLQQDRYNQGMIALALTRLGNTEAPGLILKSLSEKALHSTEMGMYWSRESEYSRVQAPIETQALLIEAFNEIASDDQAVEEMKIWLLKQKQTQDWSTSRATIEACYALLLRGTDLLATEEKAGPGAIITLGKEKINVDQLTDIQKEAGTGYFQYSWSGREIKPEMGKITVSKSDKGIAWGAVYWQYFEDLDKITPANTPLHIEKKLYIEKNTPAGPILEPIFGNSQINSTLKIGDKIKARIILTVDRNLDFVHMKDLRASALEPYYISSSASQESESGYRYQDGLGYYQSTTDIATNFFFDHLPKGTYVFEYTMKVNTAGEYSNGITTVQCLYAPEFSAHSEGIRIKVE